MEKALQIAGTWQCYSRGIWVLNGLDLEADRGEVIGLVGRNGAGKTTLIHVLMGLVRPDRGTVQVLGHDPFVQPVEVKRRVGYVSEVQILPEAFRVDEILDLHSVLYPAWDSGLADRLLARFQVDTSERIKFLSKGQARRVALVCAVAHRPELLLLDEPAGGLDPLSRREFLRVAVEILADTDATLLFSSHHLPDVERLASRVVFLDQGKVRVDEPVDRLFERHCLAVVRASARRLIAQDPYVLEAKPRGGHLTLLLRQPLEKAVRYLEETYSIEVLAVQPLDLEEFFLQLASGRAAA